MSWMLPQYLEHSTEWFEQHQDEMRKQMEGAFGGVFPGGSSIDVMQDATRRNMAAFEQAMRSFWPTFPATAETSESPPAPEKQDGLTDLRQKLAEMQSQIDALSKK